MTRATHLHKLFAMLDSGLSPMSALGEATFVPFRAKRLSNPTIVWTNDRWLFEKGVDLTSWEIRSEIETWLLEAFAFAIPLTSDPIEAFRDDWRTFHADRYGGGNGKARHGGSGRVGTLGAFQIKGIGATPLVGDVDNWNYAHGCLWMEEAIREVICSELADAEFPHGAIPVIAVIDTGLTYIFENGQVGERRALLIRPFAFRPAHMERASMFSDAENTRQAQIADVKRVRDAIHAFVSANGDKESTKNTSAVDSLVVNVAQQIAFGQVHRLFHGGYFSSNLAMGGELIDFGSFRSLPDWEKSFAMDHVPPFGDEIKLIVQMIESLVFHINKYLANRNIDLDKDRLIALAKRSLRVEFDKQTLSLWGLDSSARSTCQALIECTNSYYSKQQRNLRSYESKLGHRVEWIYPCLVAEHVGRNMGLEQAWINVADDTLRAWFGNDEHGTSQREHAWHTCARLLEPRAFLSREILQQSILGALGGSAALPPDPIVIRRLIDAVLSESRRHWPMLPSGVQVCCQVSTGGSNALYCLRLTDGAPFLWLEGTVVSDHWVIFNKQIAVAALECYGSVHCRARLGILVPLSTSSEMHQVHTVVIDNTDIEIPLFSHSYARTLNERISEIHPQHVA